MPKTCPSCGYQEPDTGAQFCNKCGYPFPRHQPGPAAPARAGRPAPRSARRPVRRKAADGFPGFGSLITEKHLKLIYIIGAVLIVLVSVMGVAGMFAKPGADKEKKAAANESFINTTAIAEYPAGSPIFWIGFLVAGSVLWRMFCELFALLSRVHGSPGSNDEEAYDEETEEDEESYAAAPGRAASGQMVECPKCHRIVALEDLRECEHCGIQGCVNCIRLMGLLKKKLTCRECYEGQ
jgi:hypothetical protein